MDCGIRARVNLEAKEWVKLEERRRRGIKN